MTMRNSTPPSRSRKRNALESYEPSFKVTPEDYVPYVGQKVIDNLRRLADSIRGKTWSNVSSTLNGGGVAEILRSAVPLVKSLGVDARWYVIEGSEAFFQVTKKFHNLLQGVEQSISLSEIFETYLDTITANAHKTNVASDVIIVHDPQPAALVASGVLMGNVLWRCHLDTSTPNRIVWRFLMPYVNQCDGAIFTMPSFVAPGLHIPIYEITPCIDPRAMKNRQYTRREAREILAPLLNATGIDPGRPIIAAISRYDIHKNQATVLKAFQKLRREKKYDPAPYLIFVGNTAADDPENGGMLERLRMQAGDDPDVHFWVDVEDNDRVVGSLMRIARMFVHVSTREGFGLVVSEALWQGTPVIGSAVGGITKQVIDGETGFLVNPLDIDMLASRMARILDDPAGGKTMGLRGEEHVRKHFLLPELVRRHLVLLRYYCGIDRVSPEFRLNGCTHREALGVFLSKYPHAIEKKDPYTP